MNQRQPLSARLLLTFRLLFAYHHNPFPGTLVRHYEFTRRGNHHRESVVSKTLGATRAGVDTLLRVPGDAATLALLSSENLAQSEARSLSRRCESDQPAPDRAFREGTWT